MSWKDLVLLLVAVIGIVLFLYGSNAYDATFGWSGLALIAVAIITEIALSIVGYLKKKEVG